MGVYKLSANSVKNGRTIYGSMLAGNTAYVVPTDYESISTVTVGSGGSSSITFSSIPGTYKHLQIRGILQSARATFSRDEYKITVNSDSGANYSWHNLLGDGVSKFSSGATNATYMLGQDCVGSNGYWGCTVVDFLDYANTNKYKTIRHLAGLDTNAAGVSGYNGNIAYSSGSWRNTNAITSITFTAANGNWNQYSQLALYGIKGVA